MMHEPQGQSLSRAPFRSSFGFRHFVNVEFRETGFAQSLRESKPDWHLIIRGANGAALIENAKTISLFESTIVGRASATNCSRAPE
jgi:hypothetical protein